jgi:membrane-associated phospholipid phosphatase
MLNRIATATSYVLHPAILMAGAMFLASLHQRGSLGMALIDTGILLAGLLPGLFYIIYEVKKRAISHYHVLRVSERRIVLPLLMAGIGVSYAVCCLIGAPHYLLVGFACALIAGAGAMLISFWWKISLHAGVPMGCAALLWPINLPAGITFAALAIIVGAARLFQHHHTPAQVISGWIYGFAATAGVMQMLKNLG